MNTWRINLQTNQVVHEPIPAGWERQGGRGLTARILLDEVPPSCDPLGPENKLIFTPGLLVGHRLSSCDRISVGAKSPLTGGIKESNAGGTTGMHLACLGIKALILEGAPVEQGWKVLHLSESGAAFEDAGELSGCGVYESAERLRERYGGGAAIALIGPGGEQGLRSAGILNLDKDQVPARINARGGLGAVMGAKRIKALVIEADVRDQPPIADKPAYKQAQKKFTRALMEHPQTHTYRDYGTAGIAHMVNMFGALPTRGFSSGRFEGIEEISGEHLRDVLLERGGRADASHACMAGCGIRCSNVYAGSDGKEIVSPLEYETIALMGANLGISSLDEIARINWEVNDLGLDSIEVGAALGVAAEAGLMAFGDANRVLDLLGEIRTGTALGRTLGKGAAYAAHILGVQRAPVVKGQAMPGYDPRAIKGTGVTYATSPQGADHTAGLTIRAKVDHLDPRGQAELSRRIQINNAGYDCLGACIFAGFGFAAAPETIHELLNARYGWDVPSDILQRLGRETLTLEREFNRRAGFTPADDRLPEWMYNEALAPTGAVFDVSDEDLDSVFDWE